MLNSWKDKCCRKLLGNNAYQKVLANSGQRKYSTDYRLTVQLLALASFWIIYPCLRRCSLKYNILLCHGDTLFKGKGAKFICPIKHTVKKDVYFNTCEDTSSDPRDLCTMITYTLLKCLFLCNILNTHILNRYLCWTGEKIISSLPESSFPNQLLLPRLK